jgi:hypothetical protein
VILYQIIFFIENLLMGNTGTTRTETSK